MIRGEGLPDIERELRRFKREVKRLTFELQHASKQTPILRAMVEGAPDAMAIMDDEGIILEHNSALKVLVGSDALMAGQSCGTLFHTRPRRAGHGQGELLLSEAGLDQARKEAQCIHGYCRDASVEIHVSPFSQGEQLLFVIIVRILGDAGKQARELHAARAHVTELNQKLRQSREIERKVRFDSLALLAGTLAHDLNNALAVVLGNLDLLRSDLEETSHVEILDDMELGCRDVSALATRLKTFSSGPTLVLAPLNLCAWLPVHLAPVASSFGIQLSVTGEGNASWVAADEAQIGQVFLNLITNAAQANAKKVIVDLSTRAESCLSGFIGQPLSHPNKRHVYVSVSDDGDGVPAEALANVFEPFFSTKAASSGLGLASVVGIVVAHEGGVCLEQSSPEGTTVSLAFPLMGGEAKSETAAGAESFAQDCLEGTTILVLEDESRVRHIIRRHLELAGANVHAVADGRDAIDTYEVLRDGGVIPTCLFDLLIEGGVGGIETLATIRESWADVDAVACSGHSDVDIAQAYHSLGFRAYVAKPFTRGALLGALVSPPAAHTD